MARNGSAFVSPLCFAHTVTNFAPSITFGAIANVLFVVFMPFWTMRFAFLFHAVSFSPKQKSIKKYTAIFVNNFAKWKPQRGPVNNSICLKAICFCQNCGLVRNTFNDNNSSVSLVKLLLAFSRPFAVFRTVAFCVVNSVKRMIVWPVAHILNKLPKTVWQPLPFGANENAAPAIIFKLRNIWISTSLAHRIPSAKKIVVSVLHKKFLCINYSAK